MGTTIQEIYIHRFVFYHIFTHVPLALDNEIIQKISKGHFLQDIKNSFDGVTQLGLEPHQNFFSTNMVARVVQSLCILEGDTDID